MMTAAAPSSASRVSVRATLDGASHARSRNSMAIRYDERRSRRHSRKWSSFSGDGRKLV